MAAAFAAPRFTSLTIAELRPSPDNPRKHFDESSLRELGESLKAGQIEPIVVRAAKAAKGYEILAGERRYRAAHLVGIETLEAKIVDCDDQRALEITVVENLQRADLHPMEEANGVASLVAAGWPADTIASHLGKSLTWVHLRSKLATLSPAWRKAIDDDKHPASCLTAGHLDMIARLPLADQNELVDAIRNDYSLSRHLFIESSHQPIAVGKFGQVLASEFLRDPAKAPWPLDDGKLVPAAGACTSCPKRTSCQTEIFPDMAGAKAGDRCLDGKCWESKRVAFIARREDELKAKNPDIIKVDLEAYDQKHAAKGAIGGNSVIREASKSDKGAKQALVVSGPKSGQTVYVVPGYYAKENPAARKAFGLPSPADTSKPGTIKLRNNKADKPKVVPIAERRRSFIAAELLARLDKAKRPPLARCVRLIVMIGTDPEGDISGLSTVKEWQRVNNPKRTADQDHTALWNDVIEYLRGDLEATVKKEGTWRGNVIEDGAMPEVAELLGSDYAALVASAAAKFPDLKEGVTAAKAPEVEKAKASPAKKSKTGKVVKAKAKKKGAA